jgi:hypothetical protein
MSDYNIIIAGDTIEPPEPIKPRSKFWYIFRFVIAGIFLLSMLYLYGFQQLTLFHETPGDAEAGTYEPVIAGEIVTVPTTVFVLTTEGTINEARSRQLIDQASAILAQANVTLSPVRIEPVAVPEGSRPGPALVTDPTALRKLLPELTDDRLHVVVTETLGGINGIAFSGQRAVVVAEYTTSFDFRVLAHEVGHALTLGHVSDRANLMSSGGSGTTLSPEQARRAYSAAEAFGSAGL